MSLKDIGIDKKHQLNKEKKLINNYAKKHDITISEYYVDEIESRYNLKNRKSLFNLLNDIEKKHIEQVIIPEAKHISRNMILLDKILKKFLKKKVVIMDCMGNNLE